MSAVVSSVVSAVDSAVVSSVESAEVSAVESAVVSPVAAARVVSGAAVVVAASVVVVAASVVSVVPSSGLVTLSADTCTFRVRVWPLLLSNSWILADVPSMPLSSRMARAWSSVSVSEGISHTTPPRKSRLRFRPRTTKDPRLSSSSSADRPRPSHRRP